MFKLIRIENGFTDDLADCGLKARTILKEYHSVEFILNGRGPSYLFRLRNTPANRPYILVKQESSIFNELNVGDILDMEYNQPQSCGSGRLFKTQITSKIPHDRYAGHSIIELSIIDN